MLYKKGDKVIGVGNLPNSKRKSLYVGNDYCITKVASFSNDETADTFESYLNYFLELELRKGVGTAQGEIGIKQDDDWSGAQGNELYRINQEQERGIWGIYG